MVWTLPTARRTTPFSITESSTSVVIMSKYKAKKSPMTKEIQGLFITTIWRTITRFRLGRREPYLWNAQDSSRKQNSRSQNIVRVDHRRQLRKNLLGETVMLPYAHLNHSSSAYAVNQITTNVFAPLVHV